MASTSSKDPLDAYRAKRRPGRTPEPEGVSGTEASADEPRFVVQKHAARRLHYDFRLEVDGVLRSWAVPRGPSNDPAVKRLAVAVEDHPLEYGDFEGVIPAGEYGAGRVIVWDAGTYRNLTRRGGAGVPMDQALASGHVVVELHGRKVHGGYALTRTGERDGQEQWILVKTRGDADHSGADPAATQPASVLSGRTLDDLEEEGPS